jgi:hypothetical protein
MKAIEIAIEKEKENGIYANTENGIMSSSCPKDYEIEVPTHKECKGEDTIRKHCRECWNQKS